MGGRPGHGETEHLLQGVRESKGAAANKVVIPLPHLSPPQKLASNHRACRGKCGVGSLPVLQSQCMTVVQGVFLFPTHQSPQGHWEMSPLLEPFRQSSWPLLLDEYKIKSGDSLHPT